VIVRASEWTSSEVASAVSGRLHGEPGRAIAGVATDTRDALAGHLFVALSGARFDAHDFLEQAVAQGAAALLVRQGLPAARVAALAAQAAVIEVDDTLRGLGLLAQAHRRRLGTRPRVVALTGSNGKTSTKEMLAAVLAEHGAVHKTEGNLNNWIGMPLTLLGARADHDFVVLELGMNALGEIAWMTALAQPDVGLVTNVGPAHVGELGGLANVARAKGELYAGLAPTAIAVVNVDDARVVEQAAARRWQRTFGWDERADVRVLSSVPSGADAQVLTLSIDGDVRDCALPYPGAHNATNAAGAVAAATAVLGGAVDLDAVVRGLAAAPRAHGRLESRAVGAWQVVDDAYNANGASMLAAIATVSTQAKARGARFVAVLGEMRELGEYAAAEHARVGAALGPAGCAVLASFGALAAPLAGAASGVPRVRHEDADEVALASWLLGELAPGDVILVKGSRGIRMERFIRRLEEVAG
jgi:UDP-N-acetylmuramoyl-tripeptide--D-alanyl-D-alanine ligase